MECLAVASHAMVNVLMIADVRKEEKMDEKAVAVMDKIYKIFREDREKAECLKKISQIIFNEETTSLSDDGKIYVLLHSVPVINGVLQNILLSNTETSIDFIIDHIKEYKIPYSCIINPSTIMNSIRVTVHLWEGAQYISDWTSIVYWTDEQNEYVEIMLKTGNIRMFQRLKTDRSILTYVWKEMHV